MLNNSMHNSTVSIDEAHDIANIINSSLDESCGDIVGQVDKLLSQNDPEDRFNRDIDSSNFFESNKRWKELGLPEIVLKSENGVEGAIKYKILLKIEELLSANQGNTALLSISSGISLILKGKIKEEDVAFVLAGTLVENDTDFNEVAEIYRTSYWDGNSEGVEIFRRLYDAGKIIQVREYGNAFHRITDGSVLDIQRK